MQKVYKERFATLFLHLRKLREKLDPQEDAWAIAHCEAIGREASILLTDVDRDHMNYCNIETAFADMFINNNQWALDHVRSMLADIKASEMPDDEKENWTRDQYDRSHFADQLKDWFEEMPLRVTDNIILANDQNHQAVINGGNHAGLINTSRNPSKRGRPCPPSNCVSSVSFS